MTSVHRLRSLVAVVAALFFVQLGGCWCDAPRPERFNPFPDPDPELSSDFCAAWAPAECRYAERCEPALHAGLDEGGGCAAGMAVRCDVDVAPWIVAIAQRRAVYDGRYARGCIEQRADRACGDPDPLPCGNVFQGITSVDGPCQRDQECAPGLFCSGGDEGCGLCTERFGEDGPCWGPSSCQGGLSCVDGRCQEPLGPGASCVEAPQSCAQGLSCCCFLPFFASCTPPRNPGERCDPAQGDPPCREDLHCIPTDGGRVCQRSAVEGESCDPQAVTAPPCQSAGVRMYCDVITRVCRPIRIVDVGEACGSSAICNTSAECIAGTCRKRPRAYEPCMAGVPPACFESSCVDGRCIPPARLGEPCDAGCPGLKCVNAVCSLRDCDGGTAWDAFVPERDGGAATDGQGS